MWDEPGASAVSSLQIRYQCRRRSAIFSLISAFGGPPPLLLRLLPAEAGFRESDQQLGQRVRAGTVCGADGAGAPSCTQQPGQSAELDSNRCGTAVRSRGRDRSDARQFAIKLVLPADNRVPAPGFFDAAAGCGRDPFAFFERLNEEPDGFRHFSGGVGENEVGSGSAPDHSLPPVC